jgi:hypothetical protein
MVVRTCSLFLRKLVNELVASWRHVLFRVHVGILSVEVRENVVECDVPTEWQSNPTSFYTPNKRHHKDKQLTLSPER